MSHVRPTTIARPADTGRGRPISSATGNRVFILALVLLAVGTLTGCLQSSSPLMGNVSGKVFDSNGHILPGAQVEIYGSNHKTSTDELGRYAISGVEPGQKRIVATYQGRSIVINVEIARGETLENADLTFAVVDGLPPVITDVEVGSLTENVATIRWVTNEPATSILDFATGPIGIGTYTYQASDSAMLLDHVIELTGLLPNITYHFRVRSRDFAGNEGISSEYQFMTPAGTAPAKPVNFKVAPSIEMERLVISWTSNTEADLAGYNLYRAESLSGPFTRVNANPIPSTASMTSYRDDGLKIGMKYYYQVKAIDTARNESSPSQTQTMVTTGTLSENRTWLLAESPYVITGDIRIRGGSQLTIEPGVEVKFTQSDSLPDSNGATMTELIVQGALRAVGTTDARIQFTSADTFPRRGSWGGLVFLSTNDPNNQLRFTTVMFADTGVRSEGSTPALENSEFGLCVVGLDLGLSTALNIRYNTIRDCNIGLVSANSNIRNNIFIDNQVAASTLGADVFEHNTVDCLVGLEIPYGQPTIRNNIFAYTGSGRALYGINQTQTTATPTISYNDISNYTFPTNGLTVATGPGNITVGPLFIGGMQYDYHLQTVAGGYASDSPCLAAGESNVQMGRYGP